jgi:hypothetical protein
LVDAGEVDERLLQSSTLPGRALRVASPFITTRFAVDANTGRFPLCRVRFAADAIVEIPSGAAAVATSAANRASTRGRALDPESRDLMTDVSW